MAASGTFQVTSGQRPSADPRPANQVKPRLKGRAHLARFADDFVLVFESEEDARRVQEVLPKRFGKYGLRLHSDKTRLVRFAPPLSGPPANLDCV
jgi:hypothetical protein